MILPFRRSHLWAAGALVALAACQEAIPPARYSEPSQPVVPAKPPSEVIAAEDQDDPPLLPSTPSCPLYCRLMTQNCAASAAAFASTDACLAQCRASDWGPGKAGDKEGRSIACFVSWAQAAAQDPGACAQAAPSSRACGGGQPGGADDDAPRMRAPVADSVQPYNGVGTCVLGLYDSTDAPSWNAGKRSLETILGKRVSEALNARGLVLRIVDVNDGLPSDISSCRAVVTSFYDGTLKNAAEYATWLAGIIASGRRVLILGDFGAYQDASTSAYLDHALVNLPLRALGVTYDAEWTNDAKKLKVTKVDKSLYRKAPSVTRAGHYYLFRRASDDVETGLEITRTDIGAGQSLVAFTSPRGGMALTRYYEDRDGNELVSLPSLIARSLGL